MTKKTVASARAICADCGAETLIRKNKAGRAKVLKWAWSHNDETGHQVFLKTVEVYKGEKI